MRGAFTTEFTTKRLTITAGKSAYSAYGSGSGFFKPMSDEMAMINSVQIGQGYLLDTDGDTDINTTDRITINSVDYDVKAIAVHEMRGLSYKKITLIKGITNA